MFLSGYLKLSTAALVALLSYAAYTKEQLYPTILFLVTSKISYVVLGNMVVATAFGLSSLMQNLFLGKLSDSEVEMLTDKAKYATTETCLALTIFRNELSPSVILLFGTLLFLKGFHWLCRSRIERLDQIMPSGYTTHFRLVSLCGVLIGADVALSLFCINYTMNHGKSVLILFAFEFGLLVIEMFNMSCRYSLWTLDTIREAGLASKGLYVMITDLICDALRFVTYLYFFALVFVYYGLPIHIIREVGQSFWELQKNATSFIKYLRLTHNLDTRFPDASPEELGPDEICMICYEGMTTGKKLPCGHIFHLECIRMWFQTRQNCPFCRAEVPVGPTPTDPPPGEAGVGGVDPAVVQGNVGGPQEGIREQVVVAGDNNGNNNRNNGDGANGNGEGPLPAPLTYPGTEPTTDGTTPSMTASAPTDQTTNASGIRSSYQPHRSFDSPQDQAHNLRVAHDAQQVGGTLGSPSGGAVGANTPGGSRTQSRLISPLAGRSRDTTPRSPATGSTAEAIAPSTIDSAASVKSTGSVPPSTPPTTANYTNHGSYSGYSNTSHDASLKDGYHSASIDMKGNNNDDSSNIQPGFYITLSDICPVYLHPSTTSGIVRSLLKGTVVFLTASTVDSHISQTGTVSSEGSDRSGLLWGRIPDGWVVIDTLHQDGTSGTTPSARSRPNVMRYRSPGVPGSMSVDTASNIHGNTTGYTPITPLPHGGSERSPIGATPNTSNEGDDAVWRSVLSGAHTSGGSTAHGRTVTSFSAMPQPINPSSHDRQDFNVSNYNADSSYVSYMTPLSQFSRTGQLSTPTPIATSTNRRGENMGNANLYGTDTTEHGGSSISTRESIHGASRSQLTPGTANSNYSDRSRHSGRSLQSSGSHSSSASVRMAKMRLLQTQMKVLNDSVVSISEAMQEYSQNLEDLVQEENE